MAGNTLLTIDMITREAVRLFKNSNLFVQNIDTQYDPQFSRDGAKIGSTLRIRLPNDYIVTQGPAMQLQSTTEQYTTLIVTDQRQVAVPFTSAERTMSIDDYSEIILAPMINNLAGKVAQVVITEATLAACNYVSNVDATVAPNAVSATGAIINVTSRQFLRANAAIDNNSGDMMTRRMVNDPVTDADTTQSLQGLLNPATEISAQFRTGMMKSGLGFERWFRDQTVLNFTAGTFSAGGTVNGANQGQAAAASAITVNAITGTLKQGDIITFAGVNACNRVTKADLGFLRQFVVTGAVANGGTSIGIYPALVSQDINNNDQQYQTVIASPANGAATMLVCQSGETYHRCLAFVQKAITMATADLVMPTKAVEEVARANYDGVGMRILTDYLPGSDQLATRIDVLFGSKTLRGEWLCVVANSIS